MKQEVDTLIECGTWKIVNKPDHKNIIGTKFVYKTKQLANGSIDKVKARLVVQGYAQVEGLDFWKDDLSHQ